MWAGVAAEAGDFATSPMPAGDGVSGRAATPAWRTGRFPIPAYGLATAPDRIERVTQTGRTGATAAVWTRQGSTGDNLPMHPTPHLRAGALAPAIVRHAILRHARSRVLAPALALSLGLLAGCASTPDRAQIPQFRQGAATANQQTAQAFSDINTFLRAQQIERAIGQPTLNEGEFLTVLADEDVAKWSRAFAVIDAYAASLEKLLDPQRRDDVQQELVKLGETIGALDDRQLPAGVAGGFATLGGLLLQIKVEKDAMQAIRTADPGIQTTFSTMMAAIGADANDGVRSVVRNTWETMLGQISVDFLRATDKDAKRAVVQRYVAALDQRDAQDASLAALRRALGLLAAAHAELAAGRNDGAQGLIDLVQREYATWRDQVDAIRKQREAAQSGQQGATP
jgi:hypothetical protein